MENNDDLVECPDCDGTGQVHSHNPKCWSCNGKGKVTKEKAKELRDKANRMVWAFNQISDYQ